MEDDDQAVLKAAIVEAMRECDDGVLLDLVYKILISDDIR